MLERLLGSVYSAFDKDPHANVAFRARHADGLKWAVRDRVLTASTESGRPLVVIGLRDKTIADVIELLAGAGCQIIYASPDLATRAADSLIAGSGRQSQSNGDLFTVYDSLLWSALDAYAVMLEDANVDLEAALRQLYLGTAEGEWLAEWGSYFGIPAEEGESDEDYRTRILVETLRPRVNAIAIEKAVLDMTGKRITLHETWVDVFTVGESDLSGPQRMQDGETYGFNIMQPESDVPIDWKKPLSIIDRNRAAGTKILPPVFRPATRFAQFPRESQPAPLAGRTDTRYSVLESIDPTALGYLTLSGYESVVNYRCNVFQVNSYSNTEGVQVQQHLGPPTTFVKASVCLSEDAELGDINCMFGLFYRTDISDFVTLSDSYALSEHVETERWQSEEEAKLYVRQTVVRSDYNSGVASTARSDEFTSYATRNNKPKKWAAKWDARNWRRDAIWSQMVPIDGQ